MGDALILARMKNTNKDKEQEMIQIPEEIRDAIMSCIYFADAHGYKYSSLLQSDADLAMEWMNDNTES